MIKCKKFLIDNEKAIDALWLKCVLDICSYKTGYTIKGGMISILDEKSFVAIVETEKGGWYAKEIEWCDYERIIKQLQG